MADDSKNNPLKHVVEARKELLDTVRIENAMIRLGFVQLPNMVIRDKTISIGARMVYAFLLSYAWQKGSCFAGQKRLADDMGVSLSQIKRYIAELKTSKWVVVKRKNMRLNNVYILRTNRR